MSIRWLIHKKDGNTVIAAWDSNKESFRKNWSDSITSIQLQRDNKKLYTLSTRKNSKNIFWQTDNFLVNPDTMETKMVARRIFKSLDKDIWLEFGLSNNKEEPEINIINKKIKIR